MVVVAVQSFLFVLLRLLLTPLLRVQTRLDPPLQSLPVGAYVVVANHVRRIDPYILLASMSTRMYRRLTPLRPMVANSYMNSRWSRIGLQLQGSFAANPVPGKLSGILGAMELTNHGQTVVIFPEGERVSGQAAPVTPHAGIGTLLRHCQVTVLPVHISYQKTRTRVRWGAPIEGLDRRRSTEELTAEVFAAVRTLAPA